ncbi:MAG: hypothetical protein K1X61_00130 [Chitinophagales bacterium]|nr:hypothetical protein [Chitinophagales bacterium]
MTKKEKKELALRLKAAIDAKKNAGKQEVNIIEKQARNNRRRQSLQKARSRKGDAATGSKHKPAKKNHFDTEPW